MDLKTVQTGVSVLKSGLNYADERKKSAAKMTAYRRKAQEIKEDQAAEESELRREAAKEKGESVAKAGASGVKVSSFNDALLSKDLETEREAALSRIKARRELNDTYDAMREERRNIRASTRNFALSGVSALLGALG